MVERNLCAAFVKGASIPSLEGLKAFKTTGWISAFAIEQDGEEAYIIVAGEKLSVNGQERISFHPPMEKDEAEFNYDAMCSIYDADTMLPARRAVNLSNQALQELLEFAEAKGLVPEMEPGLLIDVKSVQERLSLVLLKQELGMSS